MESTKRKENMKKRKRQWWRTNDAEASSQPMRDDSAAVSVVSWAWRFQERRMFWADYGRSRLLCSGYRRQGGRRLKLTNHLQPVTKFRIFGALSYNLEAFWPDIPEQSLRLTKEDFSQHNHLNCFWMLYKQHWMDAYCCNFCMTHFENLCVGACCQFISVLAGIATSRWSKLSLEFIYFPQ